MEINNYRNLNRIYDDGATVAYRAVRETDETSVILKMPNTDYPSAGVIARYQHEYDVLHALHGDGVVKVYNVTNYRNTPVLVLEDFQAQSLASWLQTAPFDLLTRLRLAIGICTCIKAVHEQGVIHRDINPSNILINPQTFQVKLADFAVSSQFTYERQEIVGVAQLEGTLAYMSPEQTGRINRPVDTRTDLYAFGITLYEMLTGNVPFEATDPLELVHAHIARKPVAPCEKNPNVPQILSDIVLKCVDKNPEDRYQSAGGLRADLTQCLDMLMEHDRVAPFLLGQRDRMRQFNVSRKLYGRETVWNEIQDAFSRAGAGATELVLISGSEGSGKSAILAEATREWYDKNVFLARGAFSDFHQRVPYSALRDLLGELVTGLLELPEEQLMYWRTKLRSALGSDASLLVGLVPYLEQLIGAQPGAPNFYSNGARRALHGALSRFLCQFGEMGQPLLLCLDDLQWADEETLELLEFLFCEGETAHLLVIGTIMEQEMQNTQPLIQFMAALRSASGVMSEVTLNDLEIADVSTLLANSLQLPEEEVNELAVLLVTKTHGNPLFTHQMLSDIHQSKLLGYDSRLGRWTWTADSITEMELTTNVVDFTIERFKTLSSETQKSLMQAACIGDRFDLQWLAVVLDKDVQMTFTVLQEAILEDKHRLKDGGIAWISLGL